MSANAILECGGVLFSLCTQWRCHHCRECHLTQLWLWQCSTLEQSLGFLHYHCICSQADKYLQCLVYANKELFQHSSMLCTPEIDKKQPEELAWIVKTKQNIINTPRFVHSALDERPQGTKETGTLFKLFQTKKPTSFRARTAQ